MSKSLDPDKCQCGAGGSALTQLFRLWMVQKRREFSWRTLLISLYFISLYAIVVCVFYGAISAQDEPLTIPVESIVAAMLVAVSIVPGDLLIKLIWRRSPVEMDDSLRSRPVPQRTWAMLVLFDTSMGFLQWMLPLAVAPVVALLLGPAMGLVSLVMAFFCTMVNALFQNCWRRAPGNQYTFPLLVGYFAWLFALYALTIVVFVTLGVAADDPSQPLSPTAVGWAGALATLLFLALNGGVGFVLHRYFCRMKNYNENSGSAAHAHTPGQVSLARMEWTAVRRSKRLRMTLLFIAPIFLLNTYLQQMPDITSELGLNSMLLFGVSFPSIMLAQYGLGVEANYAHGIWSKPWPVETILLNKFRFHSLICCVMAACCLPAVVWMDMSILTLLAVLLFSVGFFLLLMLPMCLFCSRFDLFASAFFNYQGANKQMNIYSFIIFVPMIIYFVAYHFMPTHYADALLAGLGLIGLALHQPAIKWIGSIWRRRRYSIMERWTKE